MGTRAEESEPDPSKIHVKFGIAERAVREVVAGSPRGAIRRIVLYCVVAVGALAALGGFTVAAYLGLVALVLLVATDRLV